MQGTSTTRMLGAQTFEPLAEHLLGLREHLPFFLLDVMLHILHQHLELGIVALILRVHALNSSIKVVTTWCSSTASATRSLPS